MPAVSLLVTGSTAEFQLIGHGVAGGRVGGVVVVFEEVGASAVDAHAVTLLHDPFLPGGGVPAPRGRVDGPPVGVVDRHDDF